MALESCTLVVSDVHLCGVAPDHDPWLPYRRRAFLPDDDLAALLDRAPGWARGADLEVVFNGDVFDFDAPDVRHLRREAFVPCRSREADGAADLMGAILDDHPVFVAAVQRFAAGGHRVVFIPGNHDAQLAFPAVRRVLAGRLGGRGIRFRTLFHRTPGGFLVEHGHQYDPFCVISRLIPDATSLEPTLSSIASYHVPALLGCVNPFGIDPLDVGPGAIFEAARRCASAGGTRVRWYGEGLARLLRGLATVPAAMSQADPAAVSSVASETGVTPQTVAAHMGAAASKAAVTGLFDARAYGAATDARLRAAAHRLCSLHGARGVVMGHTHQPFGRWEDGRFFGNSGTWAPAPEGGRPVGSFVWLAAGPRETLASTYHLDAPGGTVYRAES